MPEGPSIVILKEEVLQFKGKKVLGVSGNSKVEIQRLLNKKVVDVRSWGKHFLICFDKFFVKIHLLMFGSYRVNEARDITPRLSLRFTNGEVNFYNCSVKILDEDVNTVYDWETDTMSETWNPEKALKAVQASGDRMVCDVLMDQDIFAGVGNIIKNEVLFRIYVHPESVTNALPEEKLKEMIHEAKVYCFQFFEWKKQYVLRKHWLIYKAKICPRCNIPVTLRPTGRGARRSFFCNNCQELYGGKAESGITPIVKPARKPRKKPAASPAEIIPQPAKKTLRKSLPRKRA
jgi:endonuclease-8